MENELTYQEIRRELDAAIQQAKALPTEQERIEFIGQASLQLRK